MSTGNLEIDLYYMCDKQQPKKEEDREEWYYDSGTIDNSRRESSRTRGP